MQGREPERPTPPTAIEIELRSRATGRFAAVVMLREEHDIATAPAVAQALASISGNVLVDLSDCAFLDSSILAVLIAASKKLERDGHYLEIVAPPENAIVTRTLEVVGMRDLVVVHPGRPSLEKPGT